MKKVCIVGLGYIGLPTAIIAAESGLDVVGFDVDHERVARINNFDPVIEEFDVLDRLARVLSAKKFRATTTIEFADYFIIAVPTPVTREHTVDLSYVWSAVDMIIPVLKTGATIILESTVSVGTTDTMAERIEQATGLTSGTDFFAAHCPERVLPGNIFYELTHNARIIGGCDEKSAEKALEFYQMFVMGEMVSKPARMAELVKLIENSSRDVQIAFAHQVASMSEACNLDPYEVIEIANKHPRVKILNPTCGVGGHCIAVDPYFLVETFPQQTELLAAARRVNNDRPMHVVAAIKRAMQNFTHTPRVLLAGLTYKADVDDLRESPAMKIAHEMQQVQGCNILFAEPHIQQSLLRKKIAYGEIVSFADGVDQADIIVLLVGHTLFIDELSVDLVQRKTILDFCGIMHRLYPENNHGQLVSNKLFKKTKTIGSEKI